VGGEARAPVEPEELIELFDRGLPQLFDDVLHRVGDPHLAEDLTAETLLGAYGTALRRRMSTVSVGWLIGHVAADDGRRLVLFVADTPRRPAVVGNRTAALRCRW
jgi:hypothetical protein